MSGKPDLSAEATAGTGRWSDQLEQIELQALYLTSLSVRARSDYEPVFPLPLPEPKFHQSLVWSDPEADAQHGEWNLTLRISLGGPGQPYDFEAEVYGVFHGDHSPERRDDMARLVSINGASILYSACREHIFAATCRGPWGPLTLATANFSKLRPKRVAAAVRSAAKRVAELAESRGSVSREEMEGLDLGADAGDVLDYALTTGLIAESEPAGKFVAVHHEAPPAE